MDNILDLTHIPCIILDLAHISDNTEDLAHISDNTEDLAHISDNVLDLTHIPCTTLDFAYISRWHSLWQIASDGQLTVACWECLANIWQSDLTVYYDAAKWGLSLFGCFKLTIVTSHHWEIQTGLCALYPLPPDSLTHSLSISSWQVCSGTSISQCIEEAVGLMYGR